MLPANQARDLVKHTTKTNGTLRPGRRGLAYRSSSSSKVARTVAARVTAMFLQRCGRPDYRTDKKSQAPFRTLRAEDAGVVGSCRPKGLSTSSIATYASRIAITVRNPPLLSVQTHQQQ